MSSHGVRDYRKKMLRKLKNSTPKPIRKPEARVKNKPPVLPVSRIPSSLFKFPADGKREYIVGADEALSNRDARRFEKKKFGTYNRASEKPRGKPKTTEYVAVFFYDYYPNQRDEFVFGETHG
jgi:hypothetical protein